MHNLELCKLLYTAQENLMRYSQLLDNFNSPAVFGRFRCYHCLCKFMIVFDTATTKIVIFRSFSAKSRFWVVSQGTNHGANTKPNYNPSNPFRIVLICIQMNEISFEVFEMDSNASKHLRMFRIWIRMLRFLFKWFKFWFKCFESLSNGLNFDSNASNTFRIVWIWIWIHRIPFEWFEFGFESFKSLSNGSNFQTNASNPFRMLRISIRMFRIPFEWFKFAFKWMNLVWSIRNGFECVESLSNGSNLDLSDSNHFRIIRISIRIFRIPFEW